MFNYTLETLLADVLFKHHKNLSISRKTYLNMNNYTYDQSLNSIPKFGALLQNPIEFKIPTNLLTTIEHFLYVELRDISKRNWNATCYKDLIR